LYHWTHLELRFPFGVRGKVLGPDTAREIYDQCNELLAQDDFTTQGLLQKYDVRVVCSTDDPIDDLAPHRKHAQNGKAFTKLLPTWRPDKAITVHDLALWNEWVDRLGAVANVSIGSFSSFMDAIKKRHDYFHENGCRSSDHGMDRMWAADYTQQTVESLF